jgi:hypothetical protein
MTGSPTHGAGTPPSAQNPMADTLDDIAWKYLFLVTLKPRGSDDLDFHDLSVWQIRRALEAAYLAGYRAAQSEGGAP